MPTAGVAQTGTISGTVRVEGVVPAPRWLEVTKNQEVCGDSILALDVVVTDGRVGYAVASITGLEGETEPKGSLLSNSGCSFDPPILAAAVGDTLVVDNRDDVLHNTHLNLLRGSRGRTVGNWALSRKGTTIRTTRPFRREGIIEVECDAHGWMHSKILLFAHPYFAVTDEKGIFELTTVPAGQHTLKIWHEVFGELTQTVTVGAGETTLVSFSFSDIQATHRSRDSQ
jgi:plastocyanin